jgi:glucose-6-phosphate 1-dehydrogenase
VAETLPLDVRMGDPTLFIRDNEVEAEWRILIPIERAWAQVPKRNFQTTRPAARNQKSPTP